MVYWAPLPLDGDTLFFPNGDVGLSTLESLLSKHVNSPPNTKVKCFERVRVVDGDWPEYEERAVKRTVKQLRNLYRREVGKDYDPKFQLINGPTSPHIHAIFFDPRTRQSYIVDIGS